MSTETTERDVARAGGTGQSSSCVGVEVIYAEPGRIWRTTAELPQGATAGDALRHSGFYDEFPQYGPATVNISIYGRKCSLDTPVHDKDRVEVCRPLIFDPMESRRRRARHNQRRKLQQARASKHT